MKRLSTALLAAFLILPLATTSFAQTTAEGGITFAIGAPQGDFADQTDATGAGGHLFGALGFAGSPIKVGIDVGYLIYGHERRSEPFSTTIPDVTVDVTTDNNLVNGHLFLRFQPAKTTVRPYADALFGFKYLFTETRIRSEGFNNNEDIASSNNFSDTALSYGAGGGVQFQVHSSDGLDGGPKAVYIDLGARYLLGAEARYLKEGSIRNVGGKAVYDTLKSKTDLLVFQLGVAFRF